MNAANHFRFGAYVKFVTKSTKLNRLLRSKFRHSNPRVLVATAKRLLHSFRLLVETNNNQGFLLAPIFGHTLPSPIAICVSVSYRHISWVYASSAFLWLHLSRSVLGIIRVYSFRAGRCSMRAPIMLKASTEGHHSRRIRYQFHSVIA